MVSVDGSSLTVAVDGTEEQVQVSAASVQPIAPSKGDTVWFFSCFFLVCCTVFSLSCACLCVCVCVCVCVMLWMDVDVSVGVVMSFHQLA